MVMKVVMMVMEMVVVEGAEGSETETFIYCKCFPVVLLPGPRLYRQLGKCIEERNRKTIKRQKVGEMLDEMPYRPSSFPQCWEGQLRSFYTFCDCVSASIGYNIHWSHIFDKHCKLTESRDHIFFFF